MIPSTHRKVARESARPRRLYTVTITSKGQFTIPADVQRYLRPRKGDRAEFEILDEDRFAIRLLPSPE